MTTDQIIVQALVLVLGTGLAGLIGLVLHAGIDFLRANAAKIREDRARNLAYNAIDWMAHGLSDMTDPANTEGNVKVISSLLTSETKISPKLATLIASGIYRGAHLGALSDKVYAAQGVMSLASTPPPGDPATVLAPVPATEGTTSS